MSDNDRLLKHMLNGGDINPVDWIGTPPDNGKPITRMAARVFELRMAGHPVQRVGTRNRCAVYALVRPGQEKAA